MPKVKGGPKALNNLLEATFDSCKADGGSDKKCSQIAWGAASNAGWKKNDQGKWVKKQEAGLFKGVLKNG